VIDDRLAKDASLIVFLEHFSYGTRVLPLEPTAFVAELEQRWTQRRRSQQPARAAVRDVDQPEASAAIFLSYSREDSEAAVRLYEHLDALGLDVWFDRDRLEGGDAYEQKIRRQIRSCALFIPLVSRRTERRVEGFFRREWKMADERVRGIADHVPFILPVATDDVSSSSDGVPDSFKRVHWTRLAEGRPTSEFEVRIVQLVREHRKRERGLS
jgi:hypothetical protein